MFFNILNFYYNKVDFFQIPKKITYNNINHYFNNFDRKFFSQFNKLSNEDLEVLIKNINYFNISSLNKKFDLYFYFKMNQNKILNNN